MATLIATADGNFSAAGTWAVADATALLDSETGNTALTTSYVASQSFSPGAITIDALAVKVATVTSSPTGTITVRLAQGGVLVAGTEATINVSDLPATAAQQNGWILFKLAAPVTLLAATAYTLDAKTSSAAQVNLYRNATGGNWSRMLRTTTTQALAAGDRWFILGEWTAAATKTNRTVTYDLTATTDFGDASTTIASAGIGVGGTLTWGTAAATNYVLRLSGLLDVWRGGTLSMGTVATPCPADSTMELQFDCAVDGDFGLRMWSTWNGQGPPPLAGVLNHYVLLTADAAVAATSLTTDGQLSAKSGDDIAIASTTRTPSQGELRTLNADAGATSLTLSVGLTNAHGGTDPVIAEVISLSRRVRIVSVSTTAMAYVQINDGCSVDCDWVEFRYLGATTSTKRGVELTASIGTVDINKCSFRDFDAHGFYADTGSAIDALCPFSLTDNVFYKVGHQSTSHAAIFVGAPETNGWTITGNVAVSNNTGQGMGIRLEGFSGTCQNNRMTTGGGHGLYLASADHAMITGIISDNVCHSLGQRGVFCQNIDAGVVTNTTVWRTGSFGVTINSGVIDLVFDGLDVFGATTYGICVDGANNGRLIFRDTNLNGDTTFAQAQGYGVTNATSPASVRFENVAFGVASGILTTHSTADVDFGTGERWGDYTFVKCTRASATEFLNKSNLVGRSVIRYERDENVANANKSEYPGLGTMEIDTVTFRTVSPSVKLVPTAAVSTVRMQTIPMRVAVASGQACTISVYVNKSVAYNGNAPRLRVAANAAAGISEATLATHAGSAGSWVQLTATTASVTENCWLEFYVDCDGSAGQANVDDWTASVA